MFLEELEPGVLDSLFAGEEQFVVDLEEFGSDHFEEFTECFGFGFELTFLSRHKLAQLIKSPFLNLSQNSRTNSLELVLNFSNTGFELIDLLIIVQAVSTALVHKDVRLRIPVVLGDTGADKRIQLR